MAFQELQIRPIRPADMPALRAIIGADVVDLSARADRALYFVAVWNGTLIGGAGVAPLPAADPYTCELHHLHVRVGVRRRIVMDALTRHCLAAAKQFLYARCYSESRVYPLRASAREWFDGLPAPASFDGVTACALLGAGPVT
jgi:putative acetyltransferase